MPAMRRQSRKSRTSQSAKNRSISENSFGEMDLCFDASISSLQKAPKSQTCTSNDGALDKSLRAPLHQSKRATRPPLGSPSSSSRRRRHLAAKAASHSPRRISDFMRRRGSDIMASGDLDSNGFPLLVDPATSTRSLPSVAMLSDSEEDDENGFGTPVVFSRSTVSRRRYHSSDDESVTSHTTEEDSEMPSIEGHSSGSSSPGSSRRRSLRRHRSHNARSSPRKPRRVLRRSSEATRPRLNRAPTPPMGAPYRAAGRRRSRVPSRERGETPGSPSSPSTRSKSALQRAKARRERLLQCMANA